MPPSHETTPFLQDRNVYTRWSAPSTRHVGNPRSTTTCTRTHMLNREKKERDAKLRYVPRTFTLEWGALTALNRSTIDAENVTLSEPSTILLTKHVTYPNERSSQHPSVRRRSDHDHDGIKKSNEHTRPRKTNDTNYNRTLAIERLKKTTTFSKTRFQNENAHRTKQRDNEPRRKR